MRVAVRRYVYSSRSLENKISQSRAPLKALTMEIVEVTRNIQYKLTSNRELKRGKMQYLFFTPEPCRCSARLSLKMQMLYSFDNTTPNRLPLIPQYNPHPLF